MILNGDRDTFAQDIEGAADGPIIACVIGEFGWGNGWGEEGYAEENACPPIPWDRRGIPIPWSEARTYLDYTYSTGFGAPECHCITAWTESRVIFVSQYDGSTQVEWVPRNPVAHKPQMPGG